MLHVTNPFDTLSAWMAEAVAAEPRVPDAVQLATVDAEGRPSVRTVLCKEWGADGLVFYTNHDSRKATQLARTGVAAMCFHWKSLARQVLVEGTVLRLADARSDAYWDSRPRGSQLGAWASTQSATLAARAVLEENMAETRDRFEGRPVPRPPFWGGYRLAPDRFEFWQGREDRLHERVELRRGPDGWVSRLLYP